MTKCKTLLFLFLILTPIFLRTQLFATPLDNVREYTLENGLQIYLLEDSSDALIHANFVCKAGFSHQTQNTNGFFKLYTRLVTASAPTVNFTSVQCNADSSIYSLTFTPSQTQPIMQALSASVLTCDFSDEILHTELTNLKNEVQNNADTMSTYINAAIDSRVFSDTPWKHDSGIYPPLFKKTTEKTARTQISNIATRYYIPKNCALFIYGNFNTEKMLVTLKNTFGRYYSNYNPPVEKPSVPVNKQRKYVFHNEEISNELTQVVVQYTMLNSEQADLIAATYNNENSTFKQNILNNEILNIPGDEYIDISSAHKKDTTRLIIQTLMQSTTTNVQNPPNNTKNSTTNTKNSPKIDVINQVNTFLSAVSKLSVSQEEFFYGKTKLNAETDFYFSTPSFLMEKLTNFWQLQEYYKTEETDFELYPESLLASLFVSRKNHILAQDLDQTLQTLQAEEPFVFVIINSKVYKDNKKAFTKEGYQEINSTNSSWYVTQMNKNIKDAFLPEENQTFKIQSSGSDNFYFEKNTQLIKTTTLSNDIKIISKKNENSTDISLVLSIAGGKFHSSNNNGFEEVMVNLLTVLIQKEIYKKQIQGIIIGSPTVTYKTDLATSSIIINFEKEDTQEICSALSNAIIYGEVAPADADRAVSSRQFRKRLENGSANSQMLSATMQAVYGKGDISNVFDTEKDILNDTDYASILSSYPSLLQAERFSVIVTGAFDDVIFEYLEKSLNTLNSSSTRISFTNTTQQSPSLPTKPLNVKIRHTFLTDIPAEKAGPQPAVLIPTKEFLDPVFYVNESPEKGTKKAALYNAMLNYLSLELQKEVNENSHFTNSAVTAIFPQNSINLGILTISNVSLTKEADVVYKTVIQNTNSRLKQTQAMQTIVQEIKDKWILTQMSQSATNSGTALLLQKGLEMFGDDSASDFYLQEYFYIQNATVQDFIDVMKYFPQRAQMRVYSSDSK